MIWATDLDVVAALSNLGSAGLAALAVWWLTTRHESVIKSLNDAHVESLGKLTAGFDSLTRAQQQRDTAYQAVIDRQVQTLIEVAGRVGDMARAVDGINDAVTELSRRIEAVERSVDGRPKWGNP